MTGPGQRRVPVPDGLDGERVDAALARMFGLSRTSAAELISDGQVLIGGRTATKSDRVPAGEWLDVTLPAPVSAAPVPRTVRNPVGRARGALVQAGIRAVAVLARPVVGQHGVAARAPDA